MINFVVNNWDKFFTVFFAGLSAVFAIISSWLLWLEYRRNNPKIKVKMSLALAGVGLGVELVVLSIENHGRRKVVISSWYFQNSKGEKFILFNDSDVYFSFQDVTMPKILEEQGMAQIMLIKPILEDAIKEKNFQIRKLCFSDTIGNIYSYKLPRKSWKSLMNKK